MWLATKFGWYSIVEKQPGEFHIRARVRKDLENLVERVPLPGAKIHSATMTDYPFRIITGKDEVLKLMLFLGGTTDYSNFKNTIARTPDQQAKLDAYHKIWHTMSAEFGGYGRPGKRGYCITRC